MTERISLLLSHLKKIKFSLVGGNFKLMTHPLNQVDIIPVGMTDLNLIPTIVADKGDYIEVTGQKKGAFAPQKEKVDIDVYLPENSEVEINCTAGVFKVDGKFTSLHAKLFSGEFVWWHPSTDLKEGSVRMWFGDVRVLIKPEDAVVFEKNNFWRKSFSINETIKIACAMNIAGDIQVRTPKEKEQRKFQSESRE